VERSRIVGNWNTWPNFQAWLQTAWGAGQEFWSAGPGSLINAGTNLVFGQNPPYVLDDFLSFHPKFFGLPTTVANCVTVAGSSTIVVPSLTGFVLGQFLRSQNFPPGTVVTGLGNNTITVNNVATVSGIIALQVYQSPPVPMTVIQLYLNLAYASLQFARWQEQWLVGMGLFIAHYLTLYAQSDATEVLSQLMTAIHGEIPVGTVPGTVYALSGAPPGGSLQSLTVNGVFQVPGVDYTLVGNQITFAVATPGGAKLYVTWPVQQQTFTSVSPVSGAAIAAQGLAGGIQTSKSVGDVSVGYQVLESLKDWGAWNLTRYGQTLATMARVIGSGPMVIW